MLSKLTIAGLNSFTDGAIFDELNLPEGIEKDVLITEIIRQCSEFSVIYPEPEFLRSMIGLWSRKWQHTFSRWVKAYNFEYEALYNLDVTAEYTDDNTTATTGYSHTNNESLDQKASYPSEDFKNATKNLTNVNSNGNSNVKVDNKRTERRFGNQGITMSQELLQAELDVWYNNLYVQIAELFASEFCICIYD